MKIEKNANTSKYSLFEFNVKDIINGLIFSAGYAFLIGGLLLDNISSLNHSAWKYGVYLLCFLVLIFPSVLFNSFIKNRRKKEGKSTLLYLSFSLLILYLVFFVFFDLPLELQLNNYDEFSFSFYDVLRSLLPLLMILPVALSVFVELPYWALSFFDSFFTWIAIGFYVQCMFFNRYIGKITGAKYVWKNHPVFSFVNVIFWLILLAVVIFISLKYKKNKERILIFIQSSLLILGMVSFIFTLVKAPKEAFSRRQLYLDGSEQFTVGAETNVILLIADAVDNSFVKEVMNDNPEVFDVYNDFTLYTDTCSVYDLTNTSIPQMLYGYTQIEESNKSVEFLSRFDESGFRMLFYGVNAIMPGSECYISNYASSGNLEDVSSISYDLINRYFILLSVYEIVPCYFKSMIPVNIIDFDQCIVFKKNKQDVIHDNSVFEKNLRLTFNENSPKCFIYQHLDGAHLPCDDYVGETKHCLNIFGEYIKQLKELDIYDNSVIIIASDHGVHDDVNGLPYGVAATPMFMVKGKGEHYDHIVISEKPIYYRYFMATIVRYAGLTDSTGDYEIFGKSIEDYSEREVMTRVWFDGSFSSNRYRKYKYTGDTKELERVVNEGVYEEVDTLQYDYSDLD